jgi:hypothetical protein
MKKNTEGRNEGRKEGGSWRVREVGCFQNINDKV